MTIHPPVTLFQQGNELKVSFYQLPEPKHTEYQKGALAYNEAYQKRQASKTTLSVHKDSRSRLLQLIWDYWYFKTGIAQGQEIASLPSNNYCIDDYIEMLEVKECLSNVNLKQVKPKNGDRYAGKHPDGRMRAKMTYISHDEFWVKGEMDGTVWIDKSTREEVFYLESFISLKPEQPVNGVESQQHVLSDLLSMLGVVNMSVKESYKADALEKFEIKRK